MHASRSIPVETRLTASRTAAIPSRVNSAVSGKHIAAFRRALLRWYDEHRRDLPWRETRDPYRIWLSEIMLQQTRVAAVLDHYRIFLERFPNVQALAATSEDAVLAAWSGLGYYRRLLKTTAAASRGIPKPGSPCPASDATPPPPSPASPLPSP